MAAQPRLNSVIRALEEGKTPIATFVSPPSVEGAIALSTTAYDGVVFEYEHNPYDIKDLRDCLQYMLNRRQILERGTLSPGVTPLVRIPPNGAEMSQWMAKQVLDVGAYGLVWPHVSTVEEAYNAVASCRYPRPKSAPAFEPEGQRGDAPLAAARYWGLTQQEYYARADVWPLNPQGELLVIIMCEEVKAIDNLPQILSEVQGIGVVLIGEGDLSQNLGYPRQYRSSGRRRSDDRHPPDLPGARRPVRPSTRRIAQHGQGAGRGLPLPDDGPGSLLRRARRVPEEARTDGDKPRGSRRF